MIIKFFHEYKEAKKLRLLVNAMEGMITRKNIEISRLKEEIARNDRDIRALTATLAGSDIDFPNSGKGGNADNTGVDINDILDL